MMKNRNRYICLAGILIIAAGIRIVKFNTPDLVMDTVAYARLGKNLVEFGRYAFGENYNMGVFFPPGYPVFIGLTNLVFNDLFFSAKLVSSVASCISVFLAYLLGKELYDEKAGLFAALLFAIYPVFILVSVQGYSDSLFILFLLLSIYLFILSLRKDKLGIHPLTGITSAMTFYMRPEGIFILLLPFLQIFGFFNKKFCFDKRYLPKFLLVVLVFIMIISPYMLFIKNYTGKYTLSGKGNVSMLLGKFGGENSYHEIVNAPDNLYDRAAFSLNGDKTQLMGWGRDINFSMKEYVLNNPGAFLRKYQKNVLQEIQTLIKLLMPIILPLLFAFFYKDLFVNRKRLIFLLLPMIFFLIYPSFIIIEKQTFLVVVFLLIFASGGFSNSGSAISAFAAYYSINRTRGLVLLEKSIKTIIITVLILTSLSYLKYSRFQHFNPAHAKPEEHKKAGYFLKEKLSPAYESLNIMGRKPYVSFYSDSRFTMLPYAGVTDVINFAKLYNVDYVVVDERSLSRWDAYDELIRMHQYSNNVELFYEDSSDRLIKLFKIRKYN